MLVGNPNDDYLHVFFLFQSQNRIFTPKKYFIFKLLPTKCLCLRKKQSLRKSICSSLEQYYSTNPTLVLQWNS